jgi:DNA-directed RNA polymerase subunit RPC12/RpoP
MADKEWTTYQNCGEQKRPWDVYPCTDCRKRLCCGCGRTTSIYAAVLCPGCNSKRIDKRLKGGTS